MRQITIDFGSQTYPLFAGYVGEHNNTEIVAIKPTEISGEMYSFVFMTNGEVIHSRYFSADEELRIKLWEQLTLDSELFVQLEAYNGDGDYLGKSTMVKLILSNSAHGMDIVADADNPDVYSEIAQNSVFREMLEDNADTLDKLTTSEDGKLLFDGNLIEGAGGISADVLDIEVKTDTDDEYVLEISTPNETITTSNLKGKQGVSGVYVGDGDMPDGYNVQIIPDPVIEWFPPEEEELPNAGAPSPDGGSTTPTFTIEPIENGHRVTITDSNGSQSFDVLNGEKGDPYILTEADKTEIANAVLDSLTVAEGGLY